MQDEVMKHTKQIYKTVKSAKKTLGEKVGEIIIEIFIIVFAVTLSIWLHSWSLHRHQQKETTEFLVDLRDDLNKDIESMISEKDKLSGAIEQYRTLGSFTKTQIDSISAAKGQITYQINLTIRKTNNGNYEGFKSSGKIGFIENKKLKKLILEYYQESIPSLDEVEKYYNQRVNKVEEMLTGNTEKQKFFLNPVVKTAFNLALQVAENNKKNYDEITKQAKEIIEEIDKEVNE